jgi:hypothetical protein
LRRRKRVRKRERNKEGNIQSKRGRKRVGEGGMEREEERN